MTSPRRSDCKRSSQKKLAEHVRHLLLRPAEIHGVLHVAPRTPGSIEYEMARCEPSDRTTVCGEVMRALCEGPEGEPRWAADVRLGDSVRIVRKTAQG